MMIISASMYFVGFIVLGFAFATGTKCNFLKTA
jgi:hypothetical protein